MEEPWDAAEKSIQARVRDYPSLPLRTCPPAKAENEYGRCGAWARLAAFDVHPTKSYCCCERCKGFALFFFLVDNFHSENRALCSVHPITSYLISSFPDRCL